MVEVRKAESALGIGTSLHLLTEIGEGAKMKDLEMRKAIIYEPDRIILSVEIGAMSSLVLFGIIVSALFLKQIPRGRR